MASAYASQLQTLESVLKTMANPTTRRQKQPTPNSRSACMSERSLSTPQAKPTRPKWVARETWNGRECDVICAPDPNAKIPAPVRCSRMPFAHTTRQALGKSPDNSDRSRRSPRDQRHFLRRGILGKLYRGSVVSMDQAGGRAGHLAANTHYQYDSAGRKFLFSFDQHQIIKVSRYRRIGPPSQALQTVQNELVEWENPSAKIRKLPLPSGCSIELPKCPNRRRLYEPPGHLPFSLQCYSLAAGAATAAHGAQSSSSAAATPATGQPAAYQRHFVRRRRRPAGKKSLDQ